MKEMESQTKTSLKLQAYQYLKTKILNCEYRPNEFLNEQKLCAEMGNISRTPMRYPWRSRRRWSRCSLPQQP